MPALTQLEPREQLLVAAWLPSYRSARTRRAYAGDFTASWAWLADREVEVLAARRVPARLGLVTASLPTAQVRSGTGSTARRPRRLPQSLGVQTRCKRVRVGQCGVVLSVRRWLACAEVEGDDVSVR